MEVSSPAAKASLERRLQQKSRELTEIRERCKDLEHKNTSGNTEVTRLRSQLSDREARLDKLEADRRTLELEKAHYMTEVKVAIKYDGSHIIRDKKQWVAWSIPSLRWY